MLSFLCAAKNRRFAKCRHGKIAIKWITTIILGAAGAATITYTVNGPGDAVRSPTAQKFENQLVLDQERELSTRIGQESEESREEASSLLEQHSIFGRSEESKTISPAKKKPNSQTSINPKSPIRAQGSIASTTPAPPPHISHPGASAPLEMNPESSGPVVESNNQLKMVETDSAGRRWVRVYFATDRNRLDLNGYWIYVSIWLPVAIGMSVLFISVISFAAGLRRIIACAGVAFGLLVTTFFAHKAVISTQYVRVLAQSSQVAFDSARYANRAGGYPLHLGVSDVTLPPNHEPGKLERPSLLRMEWKEDDTKHVTLQRLHVMEHDEFFSELKEAGRESALVFIHGYNVRFDDALRRTAQISSDLEYSGIPILYSWPSYGKTILYARDENNVNWTVPHLETFLTDLKSKSGVNQIHIIAHSMGNRALLGVVERMGLRSNVGKSLARVVMAAPDVDASEFQDRFSGFLEKVSQATVIYGSKNDRALFLSESLHGNDRLGLVSSDFRFDACVDMVDTSPLDLSLLGHSYYGSNPIVMGDIRAFLSNQSSAKSRPWLQQDTSVSPKQIVWRFLPTAASLFVNRK